MTDDDRTEILAQAIWMQQFGTTTITQRWLDWANDNKQSATALRSQAADMVKASKGHKYHSLGWIG